jgi:gamma-glutamylcyclotransferase (GGCT)/AIG2-like uncharacterized protein YtfP
MQKLFTYGSLQLPEIQEKLFNRIVVGVSDTLLGYEKCTIEIEGEIFFIATQKDGSTIEGVVYELDEKELEVTDRYEGKEYKRLRVMLKSGRGAWFYSRT